MTAISIINAIGSLGALDLNATVAITILSIGWTGERLLRGSAEVLRARKEKQ